MDTPIPGDAQNDHSGSSSFPSNAGSSKIPAVRTLEGDAARLGAHPHSVPDAEIPTHVPVVPSADVEPISGAKAPRDSNGAIVMPEFPSDKDGAPSVDVPPSPHHAAVPHRPSVVEKSPAPVTAEAKSDPKTLNEILGTDAAPSSEVSVSAPIGGEGSVGSSPRVAPGTGVVYPPPVEISSGSSAAFAGGDPSLMAEIAAVGPNVVTPAAPSVPEKSFEEQIADLERDMKALGEKRKTIEAHTNKLFATRQTIEETLAPILKDAKDIGAEIARIEEAEKKTEMGSEARRGEEKKRWEAIEKSRTIDERKWKVKENLEGVLNDIKAEESAYQSASDEEASLRDRIQKLHVEAKRRDLKADLDKILGERGTAQEKLDELSAERASVEALLREAETKESKLEGEVADTAKKLSTAKSLGEERMLADSRYRLEKERHDVEEERWKAEDEMKHVGGDITDATKKLDEVKKREEDVKKRLDALQK